MYHTNLDFMNCMSKTLVPYHNVACVSDVNKSQYVCVLTYKFAEKLKTFLDIIHSWASKIKNKPIQEFSIT